MTATRHRVVVKEVRRRVSRNDQFLRVANTDHLFDGIVQQLAVFSREATVMQGRPLGNRERHVSPPWASNAPNTAWALATVLRITRTLAPSRAAPAAVRAIESGSPRIGTVLIETDFVGPLVVIARVSRALSPAASVSAG